ncbi:MAG: methyltransferase domain-containing protein [Candidatus Heimdallarchaeota archaeon]|nr:methyltransferase domain-containing protein [Candidatus Heimdallarchaeota archaeon]
MSPDSTRPTSSMFFNVVKSILKGDGSLRRIASHPGGKNFSIIFAYITSKAFKELLLTKNTNEKLGKDIFGQLWLSPREFLIAMEWIHEDGQPNQYAIQLTTTFFNSFVQDKALESKELGDTYKFRYMKDLDFPDDEQIALARESNNLFMMAIDDLITHIQPSLTKGEPTASRGSAVMQPLWESLHNDPLVTAFREEHIRNIISSFPKVNEEMKFVEIGVFTGLVTADLIDALVEHYSNITIKYYCVDDVDPLLQRARQKIEYHINQLAPKLIEKGITIDMEYIVQEYTEPLKFEPNSIDLIAGFQIFHYMADEYREAFLRNINQVLIQDGVFCLGQSTSHSEEFPYPFTLIYSSSEKFSGYPTKDELKLIATSYFSSIKATGLDAIWTMKKPKK